MRIVRATRRKYEVQDARGALVAFGRWHGAAQPVLYCTSSLALAVLEQRVNAATFQDIRDDFHYAEIDLTDVEVEQIADEHFEGDWTRDLRVTQALGTEWLKSRRSPVLRVRSAALSVEWNYLLNPQHPDFSRISFSEPRPIPLDSRL